MGLHLEKEIFADTLYNELVTQVTNEVVEDLFEDVTDIVEHNSLLELSNVSNINNYVHTQIDELMMAASFLDYVYILDNAFVLELDERFWEGKDPLEAVEIQAFYTFRKEVIEEVRGSLLTKIEDTIEELGEEVNDLDAEYSSLDTRTGLEHNASERQVINSDLEVINERITELNRKIDEYQYIIDNYL